MTERLKKNLAIILAGGTGSRIGEPFPKQFLELAGKPILQHTIEKFENHSKIDSIFLVTHAQYVQQTREIIQNAGFKKVENVLEGGKARQDSSRIGVFAAQLDQFRYVLIHDAARPFVQPQLIDRILEHLPKHPAINVAIPSSDTILEIDENHFLKKVPDRNMLRRAQTPQAFELELIHRAHQLALDAGSADATDDCLLILKFGLAPVYVVEGDPLNIKITYPIDLQIGEMIHKTLSQPMNININQ